MSNQFKHEIWQSQTPAEMHQAFLGELDAGKQAIEEINDEGLEIINGGGALRNFYENNLQFHPENVGPTIKNMTATAIRKMASPITSGVAYTATGVAGELISKLPKGTKFC
jgi:hypothetical protein